MENTVSFEEYHKIKKKLHVNGINMVVVSKTQTDDSILKLYGQGQRIFAENRAQELLGKYNRLPKDIEWHMIGHLQRNKVKYIASFVGMIQSVDSYRLLREIDKEAEKVNRVIPVLLQFHISGEESKYGLGYEEATEFLKTELQSLKHVEIRGVMGMASFTQDEEQIKDEFLSLKKIYDELKRKYFNEDLLFNIISMGMSGDYEIALDCGSNMVRLGSIIFGTQPLT